MENTLYTEVRKVEKYFIQGCCWTVDEMPSKGGGITEVEGFHV